MRKGSGWGTDLCKDGWRVTDRGAAEVGWARQTLSARKSSSDSTSQAPGSHQSLVSNGRSQDGLLEKTSGS